ncbi:MAG TPA: FAD-binding oxidoreductase [Mycobacteriales bacterium]|jgi:decaprenylphospho-beta-D-ribofuranose 2-oxidase|nr:FAD-binding oxidoreductase [Mycobacteriales bacterium]
MRAADDAVPASVPLAGWGRTNPARSVVVAARSVAEVRTEVLASGGRGLVARGLGRAYGDAAQNAGGVVLTLPGLRVIGEIDPTTGQVDVDAGVALDDLIRRALPLGWFVPVTPGTRYVTVGGAVASDIHGKNHHVDGSFCAHVDALDLLTADGQVRTVGPDRDPELFWATAGGMGLTGVVLRVRLRLLPVATSRLMVETDRVADLDQLMARMADDERYRYSVAWVDSLARGRALGRSVLTRGDHAAVTDLPADERGEPLRYRARALFAAPRWVPPGLLNRASVAVFNEAWFRRAPHHRIDLESIPAFFHPLDGVKDWNRIYGTAGFVQYQYAVPDAAAEVVRTSLDLLAAQRAPSFLTVLKRFGMANPGPLSFPHPGWTLAVDLPAGLPGLPELCTRLDDLVLAAGGRVYLSKDSRLPAAHLPLMYPRLAEWRAVCNRVDPAGVFNSDLARRLRLRG